MEKYVLIKMLGQGSYGVVFRALNRRTGEVVAIKKLKRKYCSWEECLNLTEVKSLRKLNHLNIVKLKEIIKENDILFLVFEHMECSLFRRIIGRTKPFSETDIRNWCFQVFQGLAYMHRCRYFHRDLKPENLLVSGDIIKIADFGEARERNSIPPYTQYVTTRWYRAPEVLLGAQIYGPEVDMWAMGAIMAEMFNLQPLFPGTSEADQLYKICSVIGSPTESTWSLGVALAKNKNYKFPDVRGVNLSALIPSASMEAIDLIGSLCSWQPYLRPTAMEALAHPFFQSCYRVPPLRLFGDLSWSSITKQNICYAKFATSDCGRSVDLKGAGNGISWRKVLHHLELLKAEQRARGIRRDSIW